MADLNLIQKIVLNQTTMNKVKNNCIIKSPDIIDVTSSTSSASAKCLLVQVKSYKKTQEEYIAGIMYLN